MFVTKKKKAAHSLCRDLKQAYNASLKRAKNREYFQAILECLPCGFTEDAVIHMSKEIE